MNFSTAFKNNKNCLEKPIFSIIIPFHNTRINEVRECLNSVISQLDTFAKEIIIVDDASTSEYSASLINLLGELEESLGKNCIKYAKLDENLGQAGARHKGYLLSSGEYVLFIDSDDYFNRNDVFTRLKEIFDKFAEASFIKSGYIRKYNNNKFAVPQDNFEPYLDVFDENWILENYRKHKDIQFAMWLYAFRRQALQDPRLWYRIKEPYEDWYFVATLTALGLKGAMISDTYYSYRAGNLGSTLWKQRKAGPIGWAKSIYKWCTGFSDHNLSNCCSLSNLWRLMCVIATMHCGYEKCAKSFPDFPDKKTILETNNKYILYVGLAKKWLSLVTRSRFFGWLLPKILNSQLIHNSLKKKSLHKGTLVR